MNIALAADGKNLDSVVSEEFEGCLYLLIVNMDDLSITVVKNDEISKDSNGENLADEVLIHNCEAVITGKIRPVVFNKLANACVTRYFGNGTSVRNALDLMEKNQLNLIRNHEGSDECSDHH